MEKQLLKEIIYDQREQLKAKKEGVKREALPRLLKRFALLPHAIVVAGIRRSGKSILLCQIMNALDTKGYYFNFEDERLINF